MGAIDNIELLARSEHRVLTRDSLCGHRSLETHALGSPDGERTRWVRV